MCIRDRSSCCSMVTDCPANLNSIWFEVKRLSIREQWANFGRPGCVEVQPRSQGSLLLVRSLAPGDGKERTLGTRLDFYAAWPVKVGPLFSNWKPLYFKPNRIQISRAIGNHRATRTPRQLGYLTSFFLHSVLLLLEVVQSHGNIIFHSTRDIKGRWNEIECTCVLNDEITPRHAQMPFVIIWQI